MSDPGETLDWAGTLAAEAGPLLDEGFLAKVGRLDVVSRRILQGRVRGEKRSKRRGQSVEFADHRQYAPGDDLRFLDWSIYARLDRLMVKLFLEEEDLRLYLLLDASASMDYGRPNKLRFAQQTIAALGYVGLVNNNNVTVATFTDQLDRALPAQRGRRNVAKLLDFLERTPCGGATDLGAACKRFVQQHPSRGLVVLVSDFLDRRGYEEALRYFVARKMDLFCLHVLSPQELEPPLAGDLKLLDAEDGDETEVTVSGPLLQAYRRNLAAFIGGLRDACLRRDVRYLTASTAMPVDRLVVDQLRRQGLLR